MTFISSPIVIRNCRRFEPAKATPHGIRLGLPTTYSTASCWVCRNCQVCHPCRHPRLPELSKVYCTRRRDFFGNLHCGLTRVHLSGQPYDAKPRALGRHHFNIIPGNSWSSVNIVKKGEERGSHSHWSLIHVSILGILLFSDNETARRLGGKRTGYFYKRFQDEHKPNIG